MNTETSSPGGDPQPAVSASVPAGERLSWGGRLRIVVLLGALVAIGPLTSDMYLPAFPAIGQEFSVDAAAVQLTLTATLVGLALGQLLIGPLSDAVGRRRPLLAGVAVHVVSSLLVIPATSLVLIDVLRVLQGLGSATATVVAMAVVRDLFADSSAARVLSRLMLVMGVSPILAPTLGGLVLAFTTWRGIFLVIAATTVLIMMAAAVALPETLPAERRRRGEGLVGVRSDYGRLVRDRTFVGLIFVTGLAMSTIFGFVSGSPFVFQGHFGLSEQEFGYLFGLGALGVVIASQLNVWLLGRLSPMQILVRALGVATLAAVVLLACSVTGAGGMLGVFIPLWVALFATGFAMPNAPALALSRHGDIAGTAAALLGAVQFGVGAVAIPVVGVIGTGPGAMAAVIAGVLIIGLVVLGAAVRPGSADTTPH